MDCIFWAVQRIRVLEEAQAEFIKRVGDLSERVEKILQETPPK
jgi:hypothetical protein